MTRFPLAFAAATAFVLPVSAFAAEATAVVTSAQGTEMGTVSLSDMPSGVVHVIISLSGAPEGVHGVHLHETGDCSATDFSSAGGHLSGDAAHGIKVEDGPHPGDMPNVTVQMGGAVQVEYFLPDLSVENDVLDADGTAFVMHAGPDDYQSQPSGNSGDRIACGAFTGG